MLAGMVEPQRKRSLRRQLATLILLIGILFLGNQLCVAANEVVKVDVHYTVPEPPPARIDVDLVPRAGGERSAYFMKDAPEAVAVQHARLPPGDYLADITLTWADGTVRREQRPIEVRTDATIEIDLRQHAEAGP